MEAGIVIAFSVEKCCAREFSFIDSAAELRRFRREADKGRCADYYWEGIGAKFYRSQRSMLPIARVVASYV